MWSIVFPRSVNTCWRSLAVIYHNDALAREQKMSPQQRLVFHQRESGPTMEELHIWLARQLEDRLVEPNSALGVAISYLLKHWEKLTLFLRVAGAPLDNNMCEQRVEEGDPASAEFFVLQDLPWRPCRRRFHEPDPHLRTRRGQSVRLPHRAGTSRGRGGCESPGLDALELPADARRHGHGSPRRPLMPGRAEPAHRRPAAKDFARLPE